MDNIMEHQTCYQEQGITQRLRTKLFRKFSYTLFITNLFGSNNMFLYNLCHHMVFYLWDFPTNITLPPVPVLTSVFTPSSHRVPPPRFFFSSHVPTYTSILPCTHTKKKFPYMILNVIITFESNLHPWQYHH